MKYVIELVKQRSDGWESVRGEVSFCEEGLDSLWEIPYGCDRVWITVSDKKMIGSYEIEPTYFSYYHTHYLSEIKVIVPESGNKYDGPVTNGRQDRLLQRIMGGKVERFFVKMEYEV